MTGPSYPALPGFGATRIFLACGTTDMRKGFDGLAVMAQQVLQQNPHCGAIFAFRGKRGDLVKLLWYDGQGLCLFSKRMDRGRFIWPVTKEGSVDLSSAQLSMLLEGPFDCLPRQALRIKLTGGARNEHRRHHWQGDFFTKTHSFMYVS